MPETIVLRSFAGGELSPSLAARADLAKYQSGLKTCRNFVVERSGGVSNRPGFRFINPCKTNDANAKLLCYVSEVEGESVLIEAGNSYLRFYLNGALVSVDPSTVDDWAGATDYVIGDLVKDGGVVYYCTADNNTEEPPNASFWSPLDADNTLEIPTPFTDPGLFNWSQSGKTITLTHKLHVPYELIFVAIDRWVFRAVDTTPGVTAPQGLTLTPGASGSRSYAYIVTAAAPETYEESPASAVVVNLSCAAPTPAAPNAITWTPVLTPLVTGVASPEYYVYCDPYNNGTFGFIGTATGAAAFNDTGITPDFTLTPPLVTTPFANDGDHPHVSGSYQQRRFFAQTVNVPDTVQGSRVGFPSNFGVSSPLQDDDAIAFRIAGNNHDPVRHIVPLDALVLLTGGGAWTVQGPQGAALAPNSIDAEQRSYAGVAEDVRPQVVAATVVYVQARGSIVRELHFDQVTLSWAGSDLTIYASHLFDGFTLQSMALTQVPNPIVWCVRSDGVLLGLTYLPEENVMGWHRHDTQFGAFVDVVCVPEAGFDSLYAIVGRQIGGSVVMYIERLEQRTILDWNVDNFFVDAGLTYNGAPVTSVSGLDHLDGCVVAVVADGAVVYDGDPAGTNAIAFTVQGGTIRLPVAASVVHVGLAIRFAEIETMPIDVAGSNVRDKKKRVGSVTAILASSSRSFLAGPEDDTFTRVTTASFDPPGPSFDGEVELNVFSNWRDPDGHLVIRQTDPLALSVLGLLPNVEVGG